MSAQLHTCTTLHFNDCKVIHPLWLPTCPRGGVQGRLACEALVSSRPETASGTLNGSLEPIADGLFIPYGSKPTWKKPDTKYTAYIESAYTKAADTKGAHLPFAVGGVTWTTLRDDLYTDMRYEESAAFAAPGIGSCSRSVAASAAALTMVL
jgi:hypothetical protein